MHRRPSSTRRATLCTSFGTEHLRAPAHRSIKPAGHHLRYFIRLSLTNIKNCPLSPCDFYFSGEGSILDLPTVRSKQTELPLLGELSIALARERGTTCNGLRNSSQKCHMFHWQKRVTASSGQRTMHLPHSCREEKQSICDQSNGL